jgi:phosphoserine phosphatase
VLDSSQVDHETGKWLGNNCYGAEKIDRFKKIYPATEIAKFYSDTLSDLPMAAFAKESYIVRGEKIVPWSSYDDGAARKRATRLRGLKQCGTLIHKKSEKWSR